jgi:hypothetical protein
LSTKTKFKISYISFKKKNIFISAFVQKMIFVFSKSRNQYFQRRTGVIRPLRHSIIKIRKSPKNSSKRPLFWHFVREIVKAPATKVSLPVRTWIILFYSVNRKRHAFRNQKDIYLSVILIWYNFNIFCSKNDK